MELFYGGNYILSCITSYNETIYQFVCKIISNSTDVEHASKMQINISNKTKMMSTVDSFTLTSTHQMLTSAYEFTNF